MHMTILIVVVIKLHPPILHSTLRAPVWLVTCSKECGPRYDIDSVGKAEGVWKSVWQNSSLWSNCLFLLPSHRFLSPADRTPERSERKVWTNKMYLPALFSFPKLLPYFSHFPNPLLILPHPGTTQPLPSQGRKLLIYKTSLVNKVWLKEIVVEFVRLYCSLFFYNIMWYTGYRLVRGTWDWYKSAL